MITYRIIMMLMLVNQNPLDELDMPCSDCHNPDGWRPLKTTMIFRHENTRFPLKGSHILADCYQCHNGSTIAEKHNFKRSSGECVSCHFDIHLSSFGQNCDICHQTNTWELTQQRYDHDYTLLPLNGAHRNLECSDCHNKPLVDFQVNLTFSCSACHMDVFNNSQVDAHSDNKDCIICHNSRAWVPSDMSNHDRLFPIYSGKHRGTWTSCTAECHINPNDYSDFSCGLNGVCHAHDRSKMDKKHRGEASGYVYESQACFQCHPRGDEGGD